ncbi:hypothetical protein J2W45_001139 [Leifsonia shinshuensis]|nr:hypothetical protein [Leifsonia shinshuensis]
MTTARLDAEDPVVAAQAILDRRHACFAGGTGRECLEAVVEAGAALLEHELTALEAGRTAAASARDYAGARVELVERWGDAALVGVAPDRALTPKSEPASLLLVRGEAGWRLRAVFP